MGSDQGDASASTWRAPRFLIALLHPCCLSAMEMVVLPSPTLQRVLGKSQYSAVNPPEKGEDYSGMWKSPWDPEASPSLPPFGHAGPG